MSAPAVRHKTLFVLLDGLGDVTIPSLAPTAEDREEEQGAPHGRTPLQAARTPTLDLLARHGLTGLMDSVEPGQACGSDTAHLSLLGYDPQLYYRGRGAFEAQGSGLSMRTGDIAFKSNFAWMDPDSSVSTADTRRTGPRGLVRKRRADRAFHHWGLPLIEALDGLVLPSFPDVSVAVQHATEHRCGVRLRGPGLSDEITGTDPLKDNLPLVSCAPTNEQPSPEARRTSAVVNELSARMHEVLSTHPINVARGAQGLPTANIVLLRGAGAQIDVPPFASASQPPTSSAGVSAGAGASTLPPAAGGHWFSRALMVAPTAIIAGLGASCGLEVEAVEGTTGDYDTNMGNKARHVISRMREAYPQPRGAAATVAEGGAADASACRPFDFAFLHVKAIDDAGHDRDVARKVEYIERADAMIAEVLSLLAAAAPAAAAAHGDIQETLWSIVVTGDHSTPVRYGDHSVEPVPFLLIPLNFLPQFANSSNHASSAASSSSPASPLARALAAPRARALRDLCTRRPLNSVDRFDEESCSRGLLGRFTGREVMPLLRRVREELIGGGGGVGGGTGGVGTGRDEQGTQVTVGGAQSGSAATRAGGEAAAVSLPHFHPHTAATAELTSPPRAALSTQEQLQSHPVITTSSHSTDAATTTTTATATDMSSSSSTSTRSGSGSAATPFALPLSPSCVEGPSAWEEDFPVSKLLEAFTPKSPASLPTRAQVVIIGAGFTGLATAWELARLGRAAGGDDGGVVILERGTIGSGATGRNGGHMHPHTPEELASVARLFEQLRAELKLDTVEQLEALLDLKMGGGVALERISKDSSTQARKAHPSVPSRSHVAASTRMAGSLHPLKLLWTLACILRDRYATPVWQQTPVERVERDPLDPSLWVVHTRTRGVVRARVVVHATNAWVGQLVPALRDIVVPVRNHLLQTTPVRGPAVPVIPPADVSSKEAAAASSIVVAPTDAAVSSAKGTSTSPSTSSSTDLWSGQSLSLNNTFDYLIQRPGGRVVLGGHRYMAPHMDVGKSDASEPLYPHIVLSLRQLLPRTFEPLFDAAEEGGANPPGSVAISHAWAGILAFTPSFNPVIGGLPSSSGDTRGQFVAAGFSGHGMPRCHPAGKLLAQQVDEYLRSGKFVQAQLPTGQVRTTPDENLCALLGLTQEQITQMQRQYQAPTSRL